VVFATEQWSRCGLCSTAMGWLWYLNLVQADKLIQTIF
jgi:hypothetical protein